ncbi:hypothetical protein V1515DRAFT_417573 [Lipomyces mesembrius]
MCDKGVNAGVLQHDVLKLLGHLSCRKGSLLVNKLIRNFVRGGGSASPHQNQPPRTTAAGGSLYIRSIGESHHGPVTEELHFGDLGWTRVSNGLNRSPRRWEYHNKGYRISKPSDSQVQSARSKIVRYQYHQSLKTARALQKSLKSEGFIERGLAEAMLAEVEDNEVALGWWAKKDGVYFYHPGANEPGHRSFCAGYADLKRGSRQEVGDGGNAKGKGKERSENERRSVPKDCGIAVIANSALGNQAMGKILSAIAYLKGWPDVSSTYMEVPFVDRQKTIDNRARQWYESWGPGNWNLVDENGLFAKFGTSAKIFLAPAAIPPNVYKEENSIYLVADGLEMMLRLG